MRSSPSSNGRFVFCTIITFDYLPYALALRDCLVALDPRTELQVLISDKRKHEVAESLSAHNSAINFTYYDQLCSDGVGNSILIKYHSSNHDAFRWAMKPVFLLEVLSREKQAIYVDSDVHFFDSFAFLFDLLQQNDLLLSPHFRSSDPVRDINNYILQFNNGIFNGGFVAANRNATSALTWWAGVCSEICEVNVCKGQYVDQSHLSLLPVFFDGIGILKHRGCNVANWNQLECRRTVDSQGCVLINDRYPIIFIHFTRSTINGILSGEDQLLAPFLGVYQQRLAMYGVKVNRLPTPNKVSLVQKLNLRYLLKYLRVRFGK